MFNDSLWRDRARFSLDFPFSLFKFFTLKKAMLENILV